MNEREVTRDKALSLLRARLPVILMNAKGRRRIDHRDGRFHVDETAFSYTTADSAFNGTLFQMGRGVKYFVEEQPVTQLAAGALASGQDQGVLLVEPAPPPRIPTGVLDSTGSMIYVGDWLYTVRISRATGAVDMEAKGQVKEFEGVYFVVYGYRSISPLGRSGSLPDSTIVEGEENERSE